MRDCRARPHTARPTIAGRSDGDANLGSRLRTGASSRVLDRDRCAGLLLRPAESVAARNEREYQRAPPAILSHGHGRIGIFPAATRCDRPPSQHAATQDAGLSHAGGYSPKPLHRPPESTRLLVTNRAREPQTVPVNRAIQPGRANNPPQFTPMEIAVLSASVWCEL
jgi:hypothetical protein